MERPDEPTIARRLAPFVRAYVDIVLEGSPLPTDRVVLAQKRSVVGRAQSADIWLDHDTVSRRHAEFYCDPFGRFWVRDLGSTNGTRVNGEVVRERVLRSGDKVGVGDYRIQFFVGQASSDRLAALRESAPSLEETSDSPPSVSRALLEATPPSVGAEHLEALSALARRLEGLEDPIARLAALADLAVTPQFFGLLAMVLRLEPGAPTRVLSGPHRPPHLATDEPPYVSRAVLRRAVETNEVAVGANLPIRDDDAVELTMMVEVAPLASLALPLAQDEQSTLVLYVNLPPLLGTPAWRALLTLATEVYQSAEATWSARRQAQAHAAIERELETARRIQEKLVPQRSAPAGLDVAFGFAPCRWVGGDYVDAVTLSDGRLFCTVADVCGKGLQAALVTFSIHTMIRALADGALGPVAILERLDAHLGAYLPDDSFVTLVSVALDPRTGAIECINAGHPPPFVVEADGLVRRLQSAENPALGMGLGLGPGGLASERSVLAPGETLVLYTDGLTELRDQAREMLGEERLADQLSRLGGEIERGGAEAMARALEAALDTFRGGELPEDDRTFLLARRV